MAIVFLRAVILLITLLIVMRFMGKRQIGEMEPFEFIITLVIAELICVPMSDVSIPLLYGIVSVLAVFILHQIFTLLERSGRFMRKVISGKPSVVINKNGVDLKELKSNNMSIDDLLEILRGQGVFSLDAAYYAIFESNGKMSVLKNEDISNEELPLLVINEGKIVKDNLKMLDLSENDVHAMLSEKNAEAKAVSVMTVDKSGKVYLQKKDSAFETFNYKSENVQ